MVNSRVRNRVRYYIIPARLNIGGAYSSGSSQGLELLALGGLRRFSCS